MTGSPDWVSDEDIGGPYGYYILIVQRGGIRLSCDGPVEPSAGPADFYDAVVRVQRRLIERQPETLREAFELTALPSPVSSPNEAPPEA
jgi:hypothetical protein